MLRILQKEASEFRSRMGFGSMEPVRLKSLLIKLNVLTLFKKLPENFSGMAIRVDDLRFMLINSEHSIGRQNFTICHELYHLYIDKNFTPHQCNTGVFDKKELTEYKADYFASYFLLPEDGIINLIPETELSRDKINLETILKIEHYFSCSRTALLRKLKEMELITSRLYNEYAGRIKYNAKQYGYPVQLYEGGNEGLSLGNFGTGAKQLFDEDKISEGHYAELMNDIGIDIFTNEGENNQD
jgi:Zn-dependent peptidase ImmA (M78 family)